MNTPLAEATTPSLEALKAYSRAWKVLHTAGDAAALPFFKRAIDIDPKFAIAHAYLGRIYGDIGESELSAENNTKAHQLRDRATDGEKFFIAATYDEQVTGNLEKAQETFELWGQTYPREYEPPGLLSGAIYPVFGKYEKAIEQANRAIALDPYVPFGYVNLATAYQFLVRLDEAEATYQLANERKLEIPDMLGQRYDLAFLRGDKAEMEQLVALGRGKAFSIPDHKALVLAYSGHLQQARRTFRRAADLAKQAARRETAALFEAGAAVLEAFSREFIRGEARRDGGTESLQEPGCPVCRCVCTGLRGRIFPASDSGKRSGKALPRGHAVRFSYLPELRALQALNHDEPAKAIEALQIAAPYELGTPVSFFGGLYPVYVRGEAYLDEHQGAEAAAEFQKILDHRGIVATDPIGALAHLQLGRALVLTGDKTKAKTAYQDFLTLWKDADPDIPIFKKAKVEYARLQ